MNIFHENINININNNIKKKDDYIKIQNEIIKLSFNSEFNEEFIIELFDLLKKEFLNISKNIKNTIFNYTIKEYSFDITIIFKSFGYAFIELSNIFLNNNFFLIDYFDEKDIDNEYFFENNNIILKKNISKTKFLLLSNNLIIPLSGKYVANFQPNIHHPFVYSYADYIKCIKNFINNIPNLEYNIKNSKIEEIFFNSELFPLDIQLKIDILRKMIIDKLPNILELYNISIQSRNNNLNLFTRHEQGIKYDNAINDLKKNIKYFLNIDDNWKVLAYAFIKQCPITVLTK